MPAQHKKDRMSDRAARRAYLLAQLHVQVEALCESHNSKRRVKDREQAVDRVLRTVIELKTGRLGTLERNAFVEHLEACSYHGEPHVQLSDEVGEYNLVHVSGVFDLEELAKRFVWSADAPNNMKVVGE